MTRPHATSQSEDSSLIRDIIHRLESPIPDIGTLHSLLASPLASISLLPPQFRHLNTDPLPTGIVRIPKHIPSIQRALLLHVIHTWEPVLVETKTLTLFEQYFAPDAFSYSSASAGELTLLAYSTILSLPLTEYSIRLLARLTREYPIDRLHSAVFASTAGVVSWEDCVRNVVCIPGKVANTLQGVDNTPYELEHAGYFNALAVRCEVLMSTLAKSSSTEHIASMTYLITKLVNLGVFPPTRPTSRSQPSFFTSCLPAIRTRTEQYAAFWSEVILALPSTFTRQAILASIFSEIGTSASLGLSSDAGGLVKREAILLRRVFGRLGVDSEELWEGFSAVVLGREWSEWHARAFVCWVAAGADAGKMDSKALEHLLAQTVQMWSSPEHVKHSLLSRHRYLTSLLLLTLSQFRESSPQVMRLASSTEFINGIGTYLGHLDMSVRQCGMLVAEVVAHRSGKKLNFGGWDDEKGGWSASLRALLASRDFDAEVASEDKEGKLDVAPVEEDVEEIFTAGAAHNESSKPSTNQTRAPPDAYDSDDSLTGYASPTSSRSVSPTPSELDEIEKDPTLNVGIKKVARPVYLAQLGNMVRNPKGTKGEETDTQEPDIVEMVLNCGEELVRRKAAYGTELEENAVNLVYGFVGLQDTFELDDFEIKRQGIVTALVACCPKKSAPSIIEEFFKNQYSTSQRYVMLNALALGARELASLSVPTSVTPFPSKMLPGNLHQKYIAAADGPVQRLVEGISRAAISNSAESTADKVPELVRERHLRVRQPAKVTELRTTTKPVVLPPTAKRTTFADVAAEFFIAPLINRFWVFLRDEQDRENRTAHRADAMYRYKAAGTGLVLHPLVLSHFLATLAVLVHAGHNAPAWLAVIAPEALELAVTLGVRPVSARVKEEEEGSEGKEAAVLTTALELALVVLDGCLEIDKGRSLRLEHAQLLMGVNEWATAVFTAMDKGALVEGGGGIQEAKLRSAAAGVLLKMDAIMSR